MKVPLSWLKDFVDITVPVEEVARLLTFAGLEVEEIHYVGLPMADNPAAGLHTQSKHDFKITGISWGPEKIVVAEIYEVMPHPNADRLTLCDLFDGKDKHIVLTGAPNLYPYKGRGKLPKPLKVAYAKEGATLYDGHADGQVLTTLKRTKIRGVESYSMVCSEKELGISEEHEGVILLDDDAPVGVPLADYIGDAVFEVKINPNMARNANVLGIAREIAALTRQPLKKPQYELATSGESVEGKVRIEISNPELNPRFTLALIRNVEINPSPYWVQRRLRLAGMRPINNIVDATNYAMLEIGQPLHAFDYDVLVGRAGDKPVVISTRTAKPGEKLTTLDGVERKLTATNVLVCDEKGVLSLAGVMGGAESEVYDASEEVLDAIGPEIKDDEKPQHGKASARGKSTANILLEAAAWNFINIRKTANQHNLPSEASYRFSRGVHPALALEGLKRCLYWMAQWSGGQIATGIIDSYPLPPKQPVVEITEKDVKRGLGIEIPLPEVKEMLERLEFRCEWTPPSPDIGSLTSGEAGLRVTAPPIRMDIGEGVVGVADIMEEVARLYGFDRIPETRMADPLPPQRGNPSLEAEERVRDLLASLGLQEIITHRMTAPEIENRLLPSPLKGTGGIPAPAIEYVKLANPIAPEKRVMRRSMLSSVLNVIERNARLREGLAMFEVGSVYVPQGSELPLEPRRLAIALTGKRYEPAWDVKVGVKLDFYDLKGIVEALMVALHLDVTYVPAEHPSFHPGKCASILLGDTPLGVFGELHPLVAENYDFVSPVLAADFDLEAVLAAIPAGYPIRPMSEFPPVLEDIAVIVDENLPADRVEALIKQTGGKMLASVRLFDVFRSEQIGVGKKSLAYALTYQSLEGTLTDKDAAQIRNRIVRRLEADLGAKLRS
jgi:phenylalanyl-tRNA synthetase beta chain